MLSRQTNPHARGDDRERIIRAREAAEALFTAKPPVSVPSVPDVAANQSARKPWVLPVTSSSPPTRIGETKARVSLQTASTPSIPPGHFARIRTLIRYGMTIAEVAAIYGVEVAAIEQVRHRKV